VLAQFFPRLHALCINYTFFTREPGKAEKFVTSVFLGNIFLFTHSHAEAGKCVLKIATHLEGKFIFPYCDLVTQIGGFEARQIKSRRVRWRGNCKNLIVAASSET
jgi:hypothetical protein